MTTRSTLLSFTIHKDDLVCHYQWTNYIKPFINSVKGFKFLVDLQWIATEYKKGPTLVSQMAKNLIQRLNAIKYLPLGNTHSLIDIDEEFRGVPVNPEVVFRAGTKYVTTSLWQPPMFPEDRNRQVSKLETRRALKARVLKQPQQPYQEPPASWTSFSDAAPSALPMPDWAVDVAMGWAQPMPRSTTLRGFPPQYVECSPHCDEEMTDGVDSDSRESVEIQMAVPTAEAAVGNM